ncbi:hypothetical protein [Pararhodospirillum oryzae]|uniref:Uncharacterized protein n=1 Tax=Pararhodospirillum oryzae TaxID=478448 RepID=A0A512HAB9_9PROT|nr:hypothetical protein [Pararhodospirillum oryzae]GEO82401.1 hypothetical protein ROR02_25320 [Pararhodospirillum oryzae]
MIWKTLGAAVLLFGVTFAVVYAVARPAPDEPTGIRSAGGPDPAAPGTDSARDPADSLEHFVLVSPDAVDTAALFAKAEETCGAAPGCSVHFWTNPALLPAGPRMSRAQQRGRIAVYFTNRLTGEPTLLRADSSTAIRRSDPEEGEDLSDLASSPVPATGTLAPEAN